MPGPLQQWYRPWRGMWATTGWWISANALTAVIGYTQCTGDNTYAGVIERSFKRARRRHQGFTNSYYDDNAWWALAWAAAYDLTRDRRYLQAAQSIFDRNTAGWDDTCGGGDNSAADSKDEEEGADKFRNIFSHFSFLDNERLRSD